MDTRELLKAVIGEDEKHERIDFNPSHGSCCTCPVCGLDYDECSETDIEIRNDLRTEQRSRAKVLGYDL